MYTIKQVSTLDEAKRVGEFLVSAYALEQTWAPNERALALRAPIDCLTNRRHRYWYVEANAVVVGAAGVRENILHNDGYEMNSDYIAVHRDYRRRGIASLLLTTIEDYVRNEHGRYIHVVSCDIPSYAPARAFYEKFGYTQVAHIPDYWVEGEGRVDYFKKFK